MRVMSENLQKKETKETAEEMIQRITRRAVLIYNMLQQDSLHNHHRYIESRKKNIDYLFNELINWVSSINYELSPELKKQTIACLITILRTNTLLGAVANWR